jgi:TonB-dependent Receptor Plug Domain
VATSLLASRVAGLSLVFLSLASGRAQSATDSVAEILAALRSSGVDVIYSTDLVTPSMTLTSSLHSGSPLERAREALALFGLTLRGVGLNRYVVTRVPATAVAPAAATPPTSNISPPRSDVLDEISVYASQYTLGEGTTGEPKSFSSVEIDRIPGDHDNALRATRLLPGVASSGSSRAYIRGSSIDDSLVEFDGVALSDPFHVRDFQSLLSAFDTAAMSRMDVYSAGFPVRYGTRSGAVIDITPRSLSSGYEWTLGASRLSYSLSTVGNAGGWPLDWLVTLRNSAPEAATRPGNGRTLGAPQFTESVGRLRWHTGADSAWTLGWLLLDDRTALATIRDEETATARYRDEYVWAAFDWSVAESLHSHTVFALSDAGRLRTGALQIGSIVSGHVGDDRSFSRADLRSDWRFTPSRSLDIEYGIEASDTDARLRYDRAEYFQEFIASGFGQPANNSLRASISPEELAYATWAAVRRRWASLEAELGARFDGQAYEGFVARQQWSPRLNLRYDLTTRWHVYGSWGHFTQAQRPEEWRIEEAQGVPDRPELAIHSTLGFAYESSRQTRFALEVYRKRWTSVDPYYDNTLEKLTLVPDLLPDRVRIAPTASQSSGLELSAHRAFSGSLDGWAAYSWSHALDVFQGANVLRSWDQPHALTSGVTWSEGLMATEAVLGWHRGWPRTPFTYIPASVLSPPGVLLGSRNSNRWGNYFTLDLRSSWSVPLVGTDFSIWAELTNSTNRSNPCCTRFLTAAGAAATITVPNDWFSRTFDIGFIWRFGSHP